MYEANYWKTVCINKNVVLFLVIKNQSDNEQKQRDNKTTTVDSFERRQTVGIAGDRFLKKQHLQRIVGAADREWPCRIRAWTEKPKLVV